ncbi:MAG: dihydrofolate reductase [Aequorivita sp.]
MITMIAAAGENNALGKDNAMIWHLPDDFKRFKKLTSGHYIIMGRRTFDSLDKALPHRTNVVITRNKNYKKEGAVVVHSMKEALEISKEDSQPFIIGGGEIYKMGLPFADKIELTRVHGTFEESDTFFPEFSEDNWKLISEVEHGTDKKHKYSFTFETWVRK